MYNQYLSRRSEPSGLLRSPQPLCRFHIVLHIFTVFGGQFGGCPYTCVGTDEFLGERKYVLWLRCGNRYQLPSYDLIL